MRNHLEEHFPLGSVKTEIPSERRKNRRIVLAVVTDRKLAIEQGTSGVVDYFTADVVSYSDYYPFGMVMPGRNMSTGESYRYAYNGMEQDNEVSGNGNSYTTEFRQYDPRLGRWKSLDPVIHYHMSPYNAMDNNPVIFSDPNGKNAIVKYNKRKNKFVIKAKVHFYGSKSSSIIAKATTKDIQTVLNKNALSMTIGMPYIDERTADIEFKIKGKHRSEIGIKVMQSLTRTFKLYKHNFARVESIYDYYDGNNSRMAYTNSGISLGNDESSYGGNSFWLPIEMIDPEVGGDVNVAGHEFIHGFGYFNLNNSPEIDHDPSFSGSIMDAHDVGMGRTEHQGLTQEMWSGLNRNYNDETLVFNGEKRRYNIGALDFTRLDGSTPDYNKTVFIFKNGGLTEQDNHPPDVWDHRDGTSGPSIPKGSS